MNQLQDWPSFAARENDPASWWEDENVPALIITEFVDDDYDDEDDRNVERAIVRERNQEIQVIAQETSMLAEIMANLASMIESQGTHLDSAAAQVEQSARTADETADILARADSWQESARGAIVDISTVAIGTGLGTLGFLAGPWVGLPTMVGGMVTATSIVAVRRKIKSTRR